MNKKVLVIVTNVSKYQGVKIDRAAGLWLGEAVHFVDEMEKYGFQIDYVSPKGRYTPIDPHSLTAEMMTPLDWKYYQNSSFMHQLGNTLSADSIDPDNYGVIWDFPNNQKLQEIAMSIYNHGGIVSSVCHGAAGILNLKTSNGKYLIDDRNVTGFSNTEEQEVQLDQLVPYLTEDELIKHNANYKKADNNWESFAVADGRLVTGQNPASGKAVADQVIKVLNAK